jgi:leader peptidase (prepilin peptidase)/N-methyltransferase
VTITTLRALSPAAAAYLLFLAAILGAVLASFAGCAVARILTGESFIKGRSRCDICGHVLSPRDLVPVLSWLTLRGKCRYCGKKIPAVSPVTELLTAVAFAAIVWRYGLSWTTLENLVFTFILLLVTLVDWQTGLIPDKLLLAGGANFVLFAGLKGTFETVLVRGFWGGAALAGPLLLLVLGMDRILGRESMGGGDIKLFFVVGLYFSWREALFILIVACVLGIALALLSKKTAGDPENPGAFPFGPAIAAAAVISLLAADPAVSWYLGLF